MIGCGFFFFFFNSFLMSAPVLLEVFNFCFLIVRYHFLSQKNLLFIRPSDENVSTTLPHSSFRFQCCTVIRPSDRVCFNNSPLLKPSFSMLHFTVLGIFQAMNSVSLIDPTLQRSLVESINLAVSQVGCSLLLRKALNARLSSI